jgi:hypothetical protein
MSNAESINYKICSKPTIKMSGAVIPSARVLPKMRNAQILSSVTKVQFFYAKKLLKD